MTRVANPHGQRIAVGTYNENTSNVGITPSPGVYIGLVKQNKDVQKMGRLEVWIEEFGGDPKDPSSWIGVSYASPFAGSTSIFDQGENVEKYEDTIKSYGWWAVPPDLDARVLVAFAAGRIDQGYWFACLYQRGTQISVPGIPAKNTHSGENKPAAPKNKKDSDPDFEKYVEHKPLSDALKKQGLENDNIRGLTSSSAMRETPSKVYGLLTPGQHQFVLDDGDAEGNNKLIRLRTSNGTQILLDDVAGHIYLISKNGENWVEMNGSGSIHVYAGGDVSIRSKNNINLCADNDINIEAGSSVNIKSKEGDINLDSAFNFNSIAQRSTKITSVQNSNIASGIAHYETAGQIHMNGPIAAMATPIGTYQLVINDGINVSICSTVPEHEPWSGHGGFLSASSTNKQEMTKDPDPTQTPRDPVDNEQGVKLNISGSPNMGPELDLGQCSVSEQGKNLIIANTGFTPIAVKDGDGLTGGFGSTVVPGDQSND